MPKSTQKQVRFSNVIRRLQPYRENAEATRLQRWSPTTLREPSVPSEMFVRALMAGNVYKPEGEEAELNVVLELCLFVDVIPGKEDGCFIGPDIYILTLDVWSPLPMPCRPLVTAQLDRFVGVDRRIPNAPLWATEVRGSKRKPVKFFRTAHWVREQINPIISPLTASTLLPDIVQAWSSVAEATTSLILFFEQSKLYRNVQTRSPPRPRPIRRQQNSQGAELGLERLGAMKLEDNANDQAELPVTQLKL